MSSPEFIIGQIVKIIDGSEYLHDLTGEQGKVEGTIPPYSKEPFWIMISLDGKGLINIRPEHLTKVDPQ